jgi:hypothetical protein
MTKRDIRRFCGLCEEEIVVGARGDRLPIKTVGVAGWWHFGCYRKHRDPSNDPWGINEHTPQVAAAEIDREAAMVDAKTRAKEKQPELPAQGFIWEGEW